MAVRLKGQFREDRFLKEPGAALAAAARMDQSLIAGEAKVLTGRPERLAAEPLRGEFIVERIR